MAEPRITVPDGLHEWVLDTYGPYANSTAEAYRMALKDARELRELERARAGATPGVDLGAE